MPPFLCITGGPNIVSRAPKEPANQQVFKANILYKWLCPSICVSVCRCRRVYPVCTYITPPPPPSPLYLELIHTARFIPRLLSKHSGHIFLFHLFYLFKKKGLQSDQIVGKYKRFKRKLVQGKNYWKVKEMNQEES